MNKALLLLGLTLLILTSCGNSNSSDPDDVGGESSSAEFLSSSEFSSSSQMMSGTFTDARDDKTYQWTKIGTQIWMAQNLDFGTYVENDWASPYTNQSNAMTTNAQKYCHTNSVANCTTYGGLYQWHTAMALPFSCDSANIGTAPCIINSPHQGICPEGWHVPTREEWTILDTWVDRDNGYFNYSGISLKSAHLWSSDSGTDDYGWSGLPGGFRIDGSFRNLISGGYWWSASQYDATFAWRRSLSIGDEYLNESKMSKSGYGFSLRCLQDQ